MTRSLDTTVAVDDREASTASLSDGLNAELLDPALSADAEPLRSPDVGLRVVRGGAVRVAGYGVGLALTTATSILLLRYLGVADFGRYMTVASLVAIVGGLTDAGLSAVAARDVALREAGEARRRLIANLLGLRLVITPLGVIGALAFAVVAGYGRTLALGAVLVGIGLVVTTWQATMTLPLSVELRIVGLTVIDVVKQAVMLLGVGLLVALETGLLPFFAVSIMVAAAAIVVSPALVVGHVVWKPAFERVEWAKLMREALPLAATVVVGVLYFRLLIVMMSLLASQRETGLFATSFRVSELLYSLSAAVVTVALPVLAVAASDRTRLRYILQRMTELSVIAGAYLALVIFIVATPVLELLGGAEYGDAAPVLRIQVFALIPQFIAQVCVVGLIAIRRQTLQAAASAVAAIVVLGLGAALIPSYASMGAAAAALVAEIVFGGLLLLLLARADRGLTLRFGFCWKVVVAAGSAAAVTLVPGLPAVAAAMGATACYFAMLWLTRGIPREVVDAFMLRREQPLG